MEEQVRTVISLQGRRDCVDTHKTARSEPINTQELQIMFILMAANVVVVVCGLLAKGQFVAR